MVQYSKYKCLWHHYLNKLIKYISFKWLSVGFSYIENSSIFELNKVICFIIWWKNITDVWHHIGMNCEACRDFVHITLKIHKTCPSADNDSIKKWIEMIISKDRTVIPSNVARARVDEGSFQGTMGTENSLLTWVNECLFVIIY